MDRKTDGRKWGTSQMETVTSNNPVKKLWELRGKVLKQLERKNMGVGTPWSSSFDNKSKRGASSSIHCLIIGSLLEEYLVYWLTPPSHVSTYTKSCFRPPFIMPTWHSAFKSLLLLINFGYWPSLSPRVWLSAANTKSLAAGQWTIMEDPSEIWK